MSRPIYEYTVQPSFGKLCSYNRCKQSETIYTTVQLHVNCSNRCSCSWLCTSANRPTRCSLLVTRFCYSKTK